ncbi:MAG: acetyl-CoA decarbonylase/synthase complex subunit delta [Planctomycetota bacterium]|nr:acetyl-CoA decarbonylase/synthase complex subunit delta [Planctomycetota bacterium]
MPIPEVKEKWAGGIVEVQIGATSAEGGTRTSVVKVGGHKGLPFLPFESAGGNKPVIAAHILDIVPDEWHPLLKEPYKSVYNDVGRWAKFCVEELKVEMIALTLSGCHPDTGNRDADYAASVVTKLKEAVGVPLIVWGTGVVEKDNAVMPKVSSALRGERVLLGAATQHNYKTLCAVAQADGHCLISEAPLDINIGKQVNILLSDMEFPLNRIVMFQATGALGYGFEYTYSIQERQRLAGLGGDKLMGIPMLATGGDEAWKAKEAKAPQSEFPQWGSESVRGPLWEITTAVGMLLSGVDILLMRHPDAIKTVQKYIARLWQ